MFVHAYTKGPSGYNCVKHLSFTCECTKIALKLILFLYLSCCRAAGDYDVEIPADTSAGLYTIRVGKFSDDTIFGCSGAFEVVKEGAVGGGMSYSYML